MKTFPIDQLFCIGAAAIGLCGPLVACAADELHPQHVTVRHELNAPPATAWRLLGHFCSLRHWQSVVKRCDALEGEAGIVRTVLMSDGTVFVERLDEFSDASRHFAYSMLSGPIAVQHYRADLSIEPGHDADHALLQLQADFDAAPQAGPVVASQLRDLFDNGMRGIDSMLAHPGARAGPVGPRADVNRRADARPGDLQPSQGVQP